MSLTQQDLELIRAGYDLWNRGDIDGLAEACFADDVEFYPDPNWPGPRVVSGVEQVKAWLRDEVAKVIGLSAVEIEDMTASGDQVVISLRVQVSGAQSGLELSDQRVIHVARVRDGRVHKIQGFLDRDEAMRAAGLG